MRYEYYSSLALVTSVVVYLLALMAHAAEWSAAGRMRLRAQPIEELVGVSTGSVSMPMRPEPVEGSSTSSDRID